MRHVGRHEIAGADGQADQVDGQTVRTEQIGDDGVFVGRIENDARGRQRQCGAGAIKGLVGFPRVDRDFGRIVQRWIPGRNQFADIRKPLNVIRGKSVDGDRRVTCFRPKGRRSGAIGCWCRRNGFRGKDRRCRRRTGSRRRQCRCRRGCLGSRTCRGRTRRAGLASEKRTDDKQRENRDRYASHKRIISLSTKLRKFHPELTSAIL